MKKILYILFLICLLTACSSDDENIEPKTPEEEKIEVTAKDIVGFWSSVDPKTQITHKLYFQSNEKDAIHEQYKNESIIKTNRFSYTIAGVEISVKGSTQFDTYKTEIYKRGEALYFLDMAFTPYKE
ncbi:hypothetical protein [Dysgonomonas reticulitermitis]